MEKFELKIHDNSLNIIRGKNSRDALERLLSLSKKNRKKFFNKQGLHKENHIYKAWDNIGKSLKVAEFIYPDDALRWLYRKQNKRNKS